MLQQRKNFFMVFAVFLNLFVLFYCAYANVATISGLSGPAAFQIGLWPIFWALVWFAVAKTISIAFSSIVALLTTAITRSYGLLFWGLAFYPFCGYFSLKFLGAVSEYSFVGYHPLVDLLTMAAVGFFPLTLELELTLNSSNKITFK